MAKKVSTGKKVTKKRVKKNVERGQAHIQSSFNNTIVTLTDADRVMPYHGQVQAVWDLEVQGNLLHMQLRWLQKLQRRQLLIHGLKSVDVMVKGPGSGREAAIRALQACGLEVTSIKDVTPVPHNGCRPPKRRRV